MVRNYNYATLNQTKLSKTLIILRHAEALGNKAGQSDFDRPLSEKGKEDVAHLANFLQENEIKAELILASSAKRTAQTAAILAQCLNIEEENIFYKKSLYNRSAAEIDASIRFSDIPNETESVILIAHNPGISEFAAKVRHLPTFINLPPCGMMVIRAGIKDWTDFTIENTEFLFQKFPKN